MEVNIAIPLDKEGVRLVNSFRFLYGKALIKEYTAAIFLFKQEKNFINTNVIKRKLEKIIKSHKRFLVEINGIKTLMPDKPIIYFSIKENTGIAKLINSLSTVLNIDIAEAAKLTLYKGNNEEEANNIYDEIIKQGSRVKHRFFAKELHLVVRNGNNKVWECLESYLL